MTDHKKRFIILLSILLITGFFLTSFASYFASLSSLRSQIKTSQLPLTSDTIYSEIQRDLLKPVFISSIMASDTFLRDWILNGEKDEPSIRKYLKEIKTRYGTITSFLVSENSYFYYHSGGILKKIDPDSERDRWYFRVRDMETDYEINIDPDMANKDTMTIFVNYKVYDYQKNYLGATGVGLTITSVKSLIERYQKKYNRDIYFIDRKGNVTLHGSSFKEKAGSIQEMQGISSLAEKILNSEEGFYMFKRQGHFVHLNTRYLPEFKWYLIVQQTEQEAVKKINRALMVNLLVCALITVTILVLTNITISVYQRRIEAMATTDKLTGLYNRHAFDLLFSQMVRESSRNKMPLSVVLFDIDLFKKVNDTLGHIAGDEVLKHIARTTMSVLRSSDVVCRWGGEEFLVLLKACNQDDAFAMAEKIRQGVKHSPAVYNGRAVPVTVSLGVAQFNPDFGEDIMLSMADQAMYRAKQKGRNRTEIAIDPNC